MTKLLIYLLLILPPANYVFWQNGWWQGHYWPPGWYAPDEDGRFFRWDAQRGKAYLWVVPPGVS